MKKKFIIPALAAAIIGGGIAGTVLNTSAFASSTDNSNSKVEVTDKQEQKQLAKEATITKEDASFNRTKRSSR